MADPGKRLKILTDSEIRELYDLPEFNSEERAQYFALSQAEESVLSSLRSIVKGHRGVKAHSLEPTEGNFRTA